MTSITLICHCNSLHAMEKCWDNKGCRWMPGWGLNGRQPHRGQYCWQIGGLCSLNWKDVSSMTCLKLVDCLNSSSWSHLSESTFNLNCHWYEVLLKGAKVLRHLAFNVMACILVNCTSASKSSNMTCVDRMLVRWRYTWLKCRVLFTLSI